MTSIRPGLAPGAAGALFLYGIVVGPAAMLGLGLLLAGARRTSHRGRAARRELKQFADRQPSAGTAS